MNELTQVTNTQTDPAPDVPPIMVPEKFVAAVFDPFKRKLAAAKRAAGKVESYDITTTAGMSQAKELRASFRDIRTALENERKARKAPIIAAGKLLDSRAAELTAEIEPLESKYDAEIKAEESRKEAEKQRKLEIERARVEAIEGRLAHIRGVPGRMASADSQAIAKEIDQWTILRLDPDDYQEYLEDALRAVTATIDQLGELRTQAEAREAEQRRIAAEREELAKLRAEQEAREKADREAAAERERLAKIERDQAAAEMAKLERQLSEMRALLAAQQAPAPVVDPIPSPVMQAPESPVDLPVPSPVAPTFVESVKAQLSLVDDAVPYAPERKRPDDGEMVEVLAVHYGVGEDAVIAWLREFDL